MQKEFMPKTNGSLGMSAGTGFLVVLVLVGLISSGFIFWSLFCLGGAAVEVGSMLL